MPTPTRSTPRAVALVLDGHSRAAAETVLALPRDVEVHVSASSDDCLCFASPRVAQRWRQPTDPAEFVVWLERQDEQHGYALIVPVTETSLVALKSHAMPPALRAKAVIGDEDAIDVALSKDRTARVAESLGIRVPKGRPVSYTHLTLPTICSV